MTLREAKEVGRALVTGFDGLLATFSFDTGVIGILVSDLGLCYGHSIAVWLVVVILPFFRFPLVRPMRDGAPERPEVPHFCRSVRRWP